MGDLLRSQIKKNTQLGHEALFFINQGKLVPDDLLIDILFCEINKFYDHDPNCYILLDGYPRNLNQAKTLVNCKYNLSFVLHLQISSEELKKRIAKRLTLENRPDDKPQKLEVRLKIYQDEMGIVFDYLRDQAKLSFHTISSLADVEDVTSNIKKLFELKCKDLDYISK